MPRIVKPSKAAAAANKPVAKTAEKRKNNGIKPIQSQRKVKLSMITYPQPIREQIDSELIRFEIPMKPFVPFLDFTKVKTYEQRQKELEDNLGIDFDSWERSHFSWADDVNTPRNLMEGIARLDAEFSFV